MDPDVQQIVDIVLRWVHVVAGVLWLGNLYFFNFVNAQLAKTYDASTKKAVVPELMPRALYWFRFGALFTWVTGLLLIGLVYHLGGLMVPSEAPPSHKGMAIGITQALIFLGVAFFIYDGLWKSPLGKNEKAAAAVSYALFGGLSFGLAQILTGRALFIHLGAILGTVMMMNVWMRIWPAQKKIILGIKELQPAPDAAVPALAALRSKHNVYMSIPVLFFMVAPHTAPLAFGSDFNWAWALGVMALGGVCAKWLFGVSAGESPKKSP